MHQQLENLNNIYGEEKTALLSPILSIFQLTMDKNTDAGSVSKQGTEPDNSKNTPDQ